MQTVVGGGGGAFSPAGMGKQVQVAFAGVGGNESVAIAFDPGAGLVSPVDVSVFAFATKHTCCLPAP